MASQRGEGWILVADHYDGGGFSDGTLERPALKRVLADIQAGKIDCVRLTLNMLLSFAQFERELGSERVRDKIAASKRRGLWTVGVVPLGYKAENKQLIIEMAEAAIVQHIFQRFGGADDREGRLGKFNGGHPPCHLPFANAARSIDTSPRERRERQPGHRVPVLS